MNPYVPCNYDDYDYDDQPSDLSVPVVGPWDIYYEFISTVEPEAAPATGTTTPDTGTATLTAEPPVARVRLRLWDSYTLASRDRRSATRCSADTDDNSSDHLVPRPYLKSRFNNVLDVIKLIVCCVLGLLQNIKDFIDDFCSLHKQWVHAGAQYAWDVLTPHTLIIKIILGAFFVIDMVVKEENPGAKMVSNFTQNSTKIMGRDQTYFVWQTG